MERNETEVKKEHWCDGCAWVKWLDDGRVMCPFVEGSCMKRPETILEPDPTWKATTRPESILNRLDMERLKDKDCPGEGKFAAIYALGNEKHSIPVWAYISGIHKETIYARLRSGMSLEQAIFTPLKGSGN